ncbi:MAG: hypothetical protein LBH40_01405, partial [Alphaproteobacteria bacterium]|nr:hypothetical protein [Alphaproteobacteria bacterium]
MEIMKGTVFFVKSDLSQLEKYKGLNVLEDEMLANTAYKIVLPQRPQSNKYSQEQVDITELQLKVEEMETRINYLESKGKNKKYAKKLL